MNTTGLKKFAQVARRQLLEQVGARLRLVLQTDSAELRGRERAVAQLKEEIAKTSQEAVIERVAYIWFNRFCALRFMDVNRYGKIGAVSPAEGFSQPEILQDAKQGHIDDELQVDRKKVFDLLGGQVQATDPQQEAYRLLLVAVCNDFGRIMPFMFQQIADYTELLMPDDLLSEKSLLHSVRDALTEETCQDVEVIGWLYQFYISEKKDQVFEGLKQNKKITPENIPAATQLFTPHWIVRYLVENSLGRLWLLNRPASKLAGQMEFYIKPDEAETDFLKVASPEELKICDPACGSGHMLTYAFDLLYLIYEEEGYDAKEIPQLILTKNLYGIEIDERAGELAAFALTMKARAKDRRFFKKSIQPNICVLKNVEFAEGELKPYIDAVGRDLFTMNLQTMLHQFSEADNFGSLIRPACTDVAHIRQVLHEKKISSQVAFFHIHPRVLKALEQAEYLRPKYHVVIANPPYMGGKGMNGRLGAWLKDNYEDVKSDLFSAFIVRNTELTLPKGQLGFMSPFVWMFLSSFEKLRQKVLTEAHIASLVRPEYHSFYESAHVPICAFVLRKEPDEDRLGDFFDLNEFRGAELQPNLLKEGLSDPDCRYRYRATSSDFRALPGAPIAYLLSKRVIETYKSGGTLKDHYPPKQGVKTGNNDRFLRFWQEVEKSKSALSKSVQVETGVRWFPCSKGGDFRRWYGNHEYLIDWENDGQRIKNYKSDDGKLLSRPQNIQYFFVGGLTWSTLTIKSISMRLLPDHFAFESKGSAIPISDQKNRLRLLAYLNSSVVETLIGATSPTMDYGEGAVGRLPYMPNVTGTRNLAEQATQISRADWDAAEASWGFSSLPLLQFDYRQPTLKAIYQKLRAHWREMTLEMQRLEEENNRIFIEAYGLDDELTPDVPLNEITLTCNPHYRYGSNKNQEELEALLLADTAKEFISYSVGCMFGRYSLDKPGLILANKGETIEDYLQQIPKPTFPADADNVIPILDGDWFMDEIAGRFRTFLKLTFGEEHYNENLKFLEDAIGQDLRKYFLKDFYGDHVQRYKKRPIYWLFSSPKGSFNALIYMHRYRPDTVSIILNDYLREFRTKLAARKEHLEQVSISASASKVEKTKALKEIGQLKQTIDELNGYENDILFPLATQKIDIDLDDGVAVNYKKFGKALKTVPGLSA